MDTHMQTQNNEREAYTAVGGPQAMCVYMFRVSHRVWRSSSYDDFAWAAVVVSNDESKAP